MKYTKNDVTNDVIDQKRNLVSNKDFAKITNDVISEKRDMVSNKDFVKMFPRSR